MELTKRFRIKTFSVTSCRPDKYELVLEAEGLERTEGSLSTITLDDPTFKTLGLIAMPNIQGQILEIVLQSFELPVLHEASMRPGAVNVAAMMSSDLVIRSTTRRVFEDWRNRATVQDTIVLHLENMNTFTGNNAPHQCPRFVFHILLSEDEYRLLRSLPLNAKHGFHMATPILRMNP